MERDSSVECSVFFMWTKQFKAVGYEIVLREIQRFFLDGAAQKCPVLKFNKGSEGFFTLWPRKLRFTNCRYICFTNVLEQSTVEAFLFVRLKSAFITFNCFLFPY